MSDTMQTGSVGSTPNMGFELAAAMTRATLHAMSEWNREMGRFLSHRLEMDAKLQEDLSRCAQPLEAVGVCSEFMQTAVGDYAREAQKLQEISTGSAAENIAAMGAGLKSNGPGADRMAAPADASPPGGAVPFAALAGR